MTHGCREPGVTAPPGLWAEMGRQLLRFLPLLLPVVQLPFTLGFHWEQGFLCLKSRASSPGPAGPQLRARPRRSLGGRLALAVGEWAQGRGLPEGVQVAPGHRLLPLSLLLCCCRSQRTLGVCRPLTGVTV